jgi:hypothetical protein
MGDGHAHFDKFVRVISQQGCDVADTGNGYIPQYAVQQAAVQSWKQNAATALEPVLMLL